MSTVLSVDEVSWVTGLAIHDLKRWREDLDSAPPEARQAIALAEDLARGGSETLGQRLTTYARFAIVVAAEADWSFAIRVLRETVLAAGSLTRQVDIDAFHGPTPSSGHRGWDATIAGAAMMTGLDRVSDPAILRWCDAPGRRCIELFDPLNVGRYRWLDYLRTPIQLQERNVILASGNLEGV